MKLGIIADIHGNDVALRAVLKDAERLDVDRWWALGDLVLFCPRPAEVLELLLGLPGIGMLRGNTDRYVLTGEQPAPHATAAEAAGSVDLVERYAAMAAGSAWTRGVLDQAGLLAVDWTGLESFSRPPPRGTSDCAGPEASWGHRKNNLLRTQDELFYGYYLSAATTAREENGAAVPEFARRATVSSCRHDPVPAFTPVLTAMPGHGIPLGDVLADSGYSHRTPQHWASPLRAAGARLVQDLHPHDRGPRGTHDGAIIANGNLYCPKTPRPLLELGPLAPAATREHAAAHDAKTAEAARYKLGRLTADDPDGYHRVQCPAATGKIRCPLRPASMTLDRDRPEILQPPEHPRACCQQQTITVPPDVLAKTAQKHDYPTAAWRRSYARRTGAERGFATAKDPASNDISRGWCRLMGLAPLMLFTVTLLAVRNQRILAAWDTRQQENQRRAAKGLPPKTRKRRRKTAAMPTAAGPP